MDSDSETMASTGLDRKPTEMLHGLASMSMGPESAKNDNVDPYLMVDIQDAPHIKFDVFLRALGVEPVAEVPPDFDITRSHQDLLAYKNAVKNEAETKRYEPFCKLANGILGSLYKVPPVRFIPCYNHYISGSDGSLQAPDVILVRSSEDQSNDGSNNNLEGYALKPNDTQPNVLGDKEKPPVDNWLQIMSVFEFRSSDSHRKGQDLSAGTKRTSGRSSSRAAQSNPDTIHNSQAEPGKRKHDGVEESSGAKRPKITYSDYKTKLARYAVHQFATVFHRCHCILALVVDEKLIMGYFDHGGAVYSTEFHFGENLSQLVLLIRALAQLGPRELGFINAVKLATNDQVKDALQSVGITTRRSLRADSAAVYAPQLPPSSEPDSKGHGKQPVLQLDVRDTSFTAIIFNPIVRRVPVGLIGRGSRVHAAIVLAKSAETPVPDHLKGILVLKASWQLARRTPEWDLLEKARNGLEGKDGMEAGSNLAQSLPKCHLRCELDKIISGIDFRSKANLAEGFKESRVWRVLISEKLEMPLYKVRDEQDFRKCFREIFQAHYWVFKTAQILHRDISIFNLMVRKGSDGTMIGVLNDWDLAEDKSIVSSGSHTGTRTGTRPFMSLDLHNEDPPAHKLRFDWESFFYFLIWSIFVIPDDDQRKKAEKDAKAKAGKRRPKNERAILEGWWTRKDDELHHEKNNALSRTGRRCFLQSPYRFSSTLETWVKDIWELFIDGYDAKSRKEDHGQYFDDETLEGHVTYEKLWDILDKVPKQTAGNGT